MCMCVYVRNVYMRMYVRGGRCRCLTCTAERRWCGAINSDCFVIIIIIYSLQENAYGLLRHSIIPVKMSRRHWLADEKALKGTKFVKEFGHVRKWGLLCWGYIDVGFCTIYRGSLWINNVDIDMKPMDTTNPLEDFILMEPSSLVWIFGTNSKEGKHLDMMVTWTRRCRAQRR